MNGVQAPVAPDPWNGTFEASTEGSICQQTGNTINPGGTVPSEDCLFINVYSPQVPDAENLLPVLVWIHGGGFSMGSGNYAQQGPEFLLSRGILYASINYRLGAFGFLGTEDDASPGNAGLKDQALALRWVQENIAAFGGDPTKVTIFGESAGATSVMYQVLSQTTVGLFRGAIADSGSSAMVYTYLTNPRSRAFQVGSVLGYSGNDTHELVEFLRTVDADELLNASAVVASDPSNLPAAFTPSFEPFVEGETQFLSDNPSNLLNDGNFQDIPCLTGVNSNEGLFQLQGAGYIGGNASIEDLNQNFNQNFNNELRFCRNEPCSDEILARVRSFYFGNGPLTDSSFYNLSYLYTDLYFTEPMLYEVDRISSKKTSPVYQYEFSYDGDLAFLKEVMPLLKNYSGVAHADELGYLFNIGKSVPAGSAADIVRANMVTLWTNFVKTGNPTPEATDDIPEWLPYNNSTAYYLNINLNITLERNLEGRRADFWKELYSPFE